jgi:ABC-2 type transport system permease protein
VNASRSLSVALAVAGQSLAKIRRLPPKLTPSLLIPLLMFAAFSGALGNVGGTKGFHYYNYTAFVFVFIFYMGAMFAAVFNSIDILGDFESGLGTRFMLAAPRRLPIVWGYVMVSLFRAALGIVVLIGIAVASGMPVRGDAGDVLALVALALLLNVAAALYGAGIALRFQTTAAGVLIMIPVFVVLFLAPAFIPRSTLTGWLRDVSDVNPLTPLFEAGRGFLAGNPTKVGLAFASAAGLIVLFTLWALLGLRKAEQGPSADRGGRRRGGRRRRRRARRSAEAAQPG